MTKEEELVLIDLSARLLYGVVCIGKYCKEDTNNDGGLDCFDITGKLEGFTCLNRPIINSYPCDIENVKSYLRPMSSMTEEEEKEFQEIKLSYHFDEDSYILLDWLNSHHFDYRGLIEKGLALEATADMYNTKQ